MIFDPAFLNSDFPVSLFIVNSEADCIVIRHIWLHVNNFHVLLNTFFYLIIDNKIIDDCIFLISLSFPRWFIWN